MEVQRGSQGQERKSRPFSLDDSSGEVGYCAKSRLESGKLFQLRILLFSSCCPLQLLRWQPPQGKDLSTRLRMGPPGCSGLFMSLQYNRPICMLFKHLQAQRRVTHTGENTSWKSFCLASASSTTRRHAVIIHAVLCRTEASSCGR